jgi:hypothetical protein
MNAVGTLLKRQHPGLSGLEEVAVSRFGFDANPYEGMQFHCVDACHWVLSTSVGGIIRVFDSLRGANISKNLREQINQLYSPDGNDISIERPDAQQQIGSSDCGLFTVAYAIDILLGNDVTRIRYDQFKMRQHLVDCLEKEQMTPFPKSRNDSPSQRAEIILGEWRTPPKTARRKERYQVPKIITSNSFQHLNIENEPESVIPASVQETKEQSQQNLQRPKWKKGDLVVNLSEKILTPSEKEVLSKGLKFCPYPDRINLFEYLKDITSFQRRMRLKEYFLDAETRDKRPEWMGRKASSFTPPKSREANLEAYLDIVASETTKMLRTKTDENWDNLTQNERDTLNKLSKTRNLVFKPADKGGALVVMDREEYKNAMLEMLNEDQYKEVKEDLNPKFQLEVKKSVEEIRKGGHIDEKEAEYLCNEEPKTPTMYGQPKIHKPFEKFPKLRPIVSGCGSICERISNLVDFYLKPLMKLNVSFVKDTTHFLKQISKFKCEAGAILVSADVSNLYTVINHEEGAQACKEALNKRKLQEKRKMPTNLLHKLILLILRSNCFAFGSKIFHQLTGTAMGTPMAPSYANIFMGKVETEMLAKFKKKTGLGPSLWLRFLDDVFFIWPHGPDKLTEFTNFMQNYSKDTGMKTNLKFTFEVGQTVPFLDTQVSIGESGKLETKLYSKDTDAHLYLRRDSCHPKSCTKGLVKGELLRARRICSKESDFDKAADKMKGYFIERGFERKEVEKTVTEIKGMKREETLEYKKKDANDRIPFVLTFHPRLRALGQRLHKHFHLLQTNERLRKAFPEAPMMAYRKLKNLRNMLVHSVFKEESTKDIDTENQGNKRCGDAKCHCCKHLVETNAGDPIVINNKTHILRKGGNCKTQNLIYGLVCKKCQKWYVGETGMKLHSRVNGHRAAIKRLERGQLLNEEMNDTGAAEHFNQSDHDLGEDAQFHILETGRWTASDRKKRESYLICKFKTLQPQGLNKAAGDMSSFYEKI